MASKVFVGNLNFETTSAELQAAFAEAGSVVEVFIPMDRATGRPRGFAFVEFATDDDVKAAIEKFDGFELKGRRLRVNRAEDKPSRGPRSPRPPRGPRTPRVPDGPLNAADFDGGGGGGGGGGGFDGGFDGGGGYRKADAPPKRSRPKGSRRNSRGKKRSL